MNDEDVEYLKNCLEEDLYILCQLGRVVSGTIAMEVVKIGPAPKDESEESGQCAFFRDGTYIGLDLCDRTDFSVHSQNMAPWAKK